MKLRLMFAAAVVIFTLLSSATAQVQVDALDLVVAGDPPSVLAELTDQIEVDLGDFENRQFSIIAYLSGPATSVDWRLQNETAGVDFSRTDRTAGVWSLCSETDSHVRYCSSLGFDGTYTLTVTPYFRSTAWTTTKLNFTIVSGTRGPGDGVVPEPIAECPRGGILVDTVQGELGIHYHFRCENGGTRVEFIGTNAGLDEGSAPDPPTPDDPADRVYSDLITVCVESAPHIVEYDRTDPHNPVVVYVPVPAGTPGSFDYCVETEDLLCDDDGVCVPAP